LSRTGLIVLALVLLIGSAAAFTRSERLKLDRSPVGKPKFERHLSPTCDCRTRRANLSFLLRRPERLDVSVVDSDGDDVATLVKGQDFNAGRVSVEWDGREDSGQLAPDGMYRLQVRLENADRTVVIPMTVVVDSAPPRVHVLEAVSRTDGILVRYEVNEGARVLLLHDGKIVSRGRKRMPGTARLTWQPMGAKDVTGLTFVAIDRARNRSEPVPVVVP
jgi:FlgD Ig-like domain